MFRNKTKVIFENLKKSKQFKKRFKLFVLIFLGFLIGLVLKSQARQSILISYDDNKIFKNNLINLEQEK